jgi:cytochrome c biogenesis protein CcmG/thiol:disulfide interchange protein DsbE
MAMTQTTSEESPAIPEATRAPQIRWGQLAVWALFAALMILMGIKLYQVTLSPVSSGSAPDFTLTTFDGESYTLSDYQGQVVVINFWASWCGPCELEAADLEQAWRDYKKRGVLFLGVDYVDTETEARVYLQEWDVTYPNGPDLRTAISQAYRIKGVPETYIVGKDGRVAETIIGPTDYARLTAILDRLLDE